MTEWLPVAVRAYTLAPPDLFSDKGKGKPSTRRSREPSHVLVLDTETTTDASQALVFGCWRFYDVLDGGRLACVHEGLLHADELELTDPAGLEILHAYGRTHRAEVDMARPFANWQLQVVSRRQFLDGVLYKGAYRRPKAMVVAFNFPFDASRLAVSAAPANRYVRRRKEHLEDPRRLSSFAGGFSLKLWDYEGTDNQYRPRIAIKTIDSKRALKGFRSPSLIEEADLDNGAAFKGHFLDARTLAFALTSQGHTLESASGEFGVPYTKRPVSHGQITEGYVTYCREDVEATANLYEAAMAEFRSHPIALQATRTYSPASIAKAYLRAMGIRPVLERQKSFDPQVLGWATSAFYGGRAECRIRKTPVPVELVDFTSMYPTVDALMGLWGLLSSKRIKTTTETESVQTLLDSVDLDTCFDPTVWPQLVGIAQVVPDGDVLPCRALYDEKSWNIGITPLTARDQMWFTLADLVASKVLTGKSPSVIKALRFIASPEQLDLQPVRLRKQIDVDPTSTDFFTTVVEVRQRIKQTTKGHPPTCRCEACRTAQFLKVLANSGSYGIYAEMVRHELGAKKGVEVEVFSNGAEPFTTKTGAPETPGEYCFPPIAACITGAARLMLALLEAAVAESGGSWAMCDTDSMAIVADEAGSLVPCPGGRERSQDGRQAIRALSFAQVEAVRNRFDGLNPYARDAVPDSILKSEVQTHCYVISAKRYALYDVVDGQVVLSNKKAPSEHGLGHLADPSREDHSEEEPDPEDPDEELGDPQAKGRAWVAEAWTWMLSRAEGLACDEPAWLDRLAVSRLAISSPTLLHPFESLNKGKPYRDQVKPYNFMLAAHVAPFGHPAGVDPSRFRLVAPFERLASKWAGLPWRNLYDGTGHVFSISTRSSLGERREPDEVRVQSLRHVLREYGNHPEAKSLGPDGTVCGRVTRGVLGRRPVAASLIHHIGKEANRLEDVEAGLVGDLDEVLNEYVDPKNDSLRSLVLPVLQGLSDRKVGELADCDDKTVGAIRRGVTTSPRKETVEKLLRLAIEVAEDQPVDDRSPEATALLVESKMTQRPHPERRSWTRQ